MDIRWLEFVVYYVVIPVAFAIAVHRLDYRGAMAPVLWIVSLALGIALCRDPAFERERLWRLPFDHPYMITVLPRFIVLSAGLLALGRWLTPGSFLWMPRNRPRLWLALVVAYPVLSAVPQGLIWRVFLAQRYAGLFSTPIMLLLAGATAFSLAHLAFWNATAIVVTAVGGAIFFATYLETHSMLLAALEHGAYGLVAFAAGFGTYLHRGLRHSPRAQPDSNAAARELLGAGREPR